MSSIESLRERVSAKKKKKKKEQVRDPIIGRQGKSPLTDTPVAFERRGWLSMRADGAAALIPLEIIF
jgi:hypothetical protein